MENAKEWVNKNPTSSLFFVFLMIVTPVEKIILPYYSAQILQNLKRDKSDLLISIIHWAVLFVFLNITHLIYENQRHSIVSELNNNSVQNIFDQMMNSEWSVSDNDVFELLSIIQSSNAYSWKVIDIASSILGAQIFTLVGTVHVFAQNSTWYVNAILIISILIGFKCVNHIVDYCKEDIEQYNIHKSATLSQIADIISSRSIVDNTDNKDKLIQPALESLSIQNKKEFSCRFNLSKNLNTVSFITTILIYYFLFFDLFYGNISSDNFTNLFLVSQNVFEMPLTLSNSLYETMHINVFENSIHERFQAKKNHEIIRRDYIQITNLKIRNLPVIQAPVYLKIKNGSIVSLTGPNGCGKSSLLRIIAGLEAPSNDDAVIIAPYSMYVPQNANLVNKSIIENVGLGLPKNPSEKQIISMLSENSLQSYISVFQPFMHSPLGELGKKLSGGQRQIIWMLRLIFSNKKCALLDEPTAWMSKQVTESYLKCLRKNKITALIVTHDKNVQDFADIELDWNDILFSN
jgi:ATP-binding cassette subfamily B protein